MSLSDSSTVDSRQVVLLTSAIYPTDDVPYTALSAEERIPLYKEAFEFWANFCIQVGFQLAIVDSTGASADFMLSPRHLQSVKFMNFSPSSDLNKLGKGARESACLDYAFEILHDEFGPDITVHKVTGRLKIMNANRVLHEVSENTLRIRRSLDRSVMDTRVYSLRCGMWRTYFTKMHSETNDHDNTRYVEHVTAQRSILAQYWSKMQVEQFSAFPKIRGISGTNGKAYGGFSHNGWSNFKEIFERRVLGRFKTRLL